MSGLWKNSKLQESLRLERERAAQKTQAEEAKPPISKEPEPIQKENPPPAPHPIPTPMEKNPPEPVYTPVPENEGYEPYESESLDEMDFQDESVEEDSGDESFLFRMEPNPDSKGRIIFTPVKPKKVTFDRPTFQPPSRKRPRPEEFYDDEEYEDPNPYPLSTSVPKAKKPDPGTKGETSSWIPDYVVNMGYSAGKQLGWGLAMLLLVAAKSTMQKMATPNPTYSSYSPPPSTPHPPIDPNYQPPAVDPYPPVNTNRLSRFV